MSNLGFLQAEWVLVHEDWSWHDRLDHNQREHRFFFGKP